MGIRRAEQDVVAELGGPGRGRQEPPDFAPETGPGRRLAGYLRFGYRRRVRGSSCPGFPQGRRRAQGPPQGLRRPGGSRASRLLIHNPTRPWRSHGKSAVATSCGRHERMYRNSNGSRRYQGTYRSLHRHPLPRRFRGHAGAELRDPEPAGRLGHQGHHRRHRKRLRHGRCRPEDRRPHLPQGIRHAGRARRHQGGRHGRSLSGARRERAGRSRAEPRQGAPRGKLDQAGKGLQRPDPRHRRDLRPRQGRLHRRSRRRRGLPARSARSTCARCAMSAR